MIVNFESGILARKLTALDTKNLYENVQRENLFSLENYFLLLPS